MVSLFYCTRVQIPYSETLSCINNGKMKMHDQHYRNYLTLFSTKLALVLLFSISFCSFNSYSLTVFYSLIKLRVHKRYTFLVQKSSCHQVLQSS